LIAAIAVGNTAATEELVEAFLPAIGGVAFLYRGIASLEQAEFLQEGVVGLLMAAKRYDLKFQTPFWAYASWWVRQAMQRLVSELSGPVVLSDRAARRLIRIKRARGEFQQSHKREPSIGDLADATELSRSQVENLISVERPPRALDARTPEGAEATFAEGLPDPAAEDDYERVGVRIDAEHLSELTDGLEARERDIVFAHYGIGRARQTLREIAGRLHISVERVRQLEERALEACGRWPSSRTQRKMAAPSRTQPPRHRAKRPSHYREGSAEPFQ
jgi:RNA polymerase sigma factor (sigma-70 family)